MAFTFEFETYFFDTRWRFQYYLLSTKQVF